MSVFIPPSHNHDGGTTEVEFELFQNYLQNPPLCVLCPVSLGGDLVVCHDKYENPRDTQRNQVRKIRFVSKIFSLLLKW